MPHRWANVASDVLTIDGNEDYLQAPPWAEAYHIRTDEAAGTGADVDWKYLNKVTAALFYDDSLGTYTNYADELQDKYETSRVMVLDDMQTEDYVYLGFEVPVRGIYIDVGAGDAGAGVMSVDYWDGSAWSDITPTDGGSNWGSDGEVTWTVPTDWVSNQVDAVAGKFWVRISTSLDLDSEVEIRAILGLHKESIDSAPAKIDAGTSEDGVEGLTFFDKRKVNGIQFKQAGSAAPTVSVTWFGK